MRTPSTTSSVPVMNDPARSEARRSVAPTSSRASPKRPIGVWARIEPTRSGVRTFRFCSAGKKPGTRTFTRMPRGAHSRARFFETLWTAAFEAE